jgi:hypothetical protein
MCQDDLVLRVSFQWRSTEQAVAEAVADERLRLARVVKRNWWDGREPMAAFITRLGNVLTDEFADDPRI